MNRSTTLLGATRSWAAPHLEHEEVRLLRGPRTGIPVVVAIHSTEAGPATGGCRLREYDHWTDGVTDALRLSEAMTTKCALGGLPHGGGKTVAILREPIDPTQHDLLIRDIGDLIGSFEGRYITGPDIGTSPHDMQVLHDATGGFAYCRPESAGGSGNSNTATARGVLAALRAAVEHELGGRSVSGLRVGVVGHGQVGRLLAKDLAADGATVQVHDIDATHRRDVESSGMAWWDTPSPSDPVDILVPAATGGVLTPETARTCRARLIVGPANNQLTDDVVDQVLHRRGITWVPDVLASSGGVIYAVSREGLGLDHAAAIGRVDSIAATTGELLAEVGGQHATPLQAARRIAQERIRGAA